MNMESAILKMRSWQNIAEVSFHYGFDQSLNLSAIAATLPRLGVLKLSVPGFLVDKLATFRELTHLSLRWSDMPHQEESDGISDYAEVLRYLDTKLKSLCLSVNLETEAWNWISSKCLSGLKELRVQVLYEGKSDEIYLEYVEPCTDGVKAMTSLESLEHLELRVGLDIKGLDLFCRWKKLEVLRLDVHRQCVWDGCSRYEGCQQALSDHFKSIFPDAQGTLVLIYPDTIPLYKEFYFSR